MLNPTFKNINRLFVLPLKNDDNDSTRDSFNKYHMLLVETKHFNVLTDNEPIFYQPVKTNKKPTKTC